MRTRQKPQIIDITKSFEVMDPNTFVESMVSTEREDGEEKVISVVAYEGYNFLATPYGYKSFFGTNSRLGTATLPNRTQFVVPIENSDGKIYFIALHEAGISYQDTSIGSVWNSIWTLAFDHEVFREWTYCFIESDLYCYAAGKNKVLKITPAAALTEISPSFLNMAGQLGIFRASNRLGFWDSAGSVSWSSSLDFSDFVPSIENMAGNRIFSDVIGNIVAIK